MSEADGPKVLRKADGAFGWEGVARHPYKEVDSAPFRAISRQTLVADPRLLGELRYFEIEPGGFWTLRTARAHACGDGPARARALPRRRARA